MARLIHHADAFAASGLVAVVSKLDRVEFEGIDGLLHFALANVVIVQEGIYNVVHCMVPNVSNPQWQTYQCAAVRDGECCRLLLVAISAGEAVDGPEEVGGE